MPVEVAVELPVEVREVDECLWWCVLVEVALVEFPVDVALSEEDDAAFEEVLVELLLPSLLLSVEEAESEVVMTGFLFFPRACPSAFHQ